MNGKRSKALKLRLRGFSYNEIGKKLEVPKSTLSSWLSQVVLSQSAQGRLRSRIHQGTLKGLVRRNKLQTHQARQRMHAIQNNAEQEIGLSFTKRDLQLVGCALYWAEGYKKLKKTKEGRELTNHMISLTNSDPIMIHVFIRFLTEVLEIPKQRIFLGLRLFEHMNEEHVLSYWRKMTGLPKEQCYKPLYPVSKSSISKRPYNRLPYGTAQVIVCDTPSFHRLMGWIKGVTKIA